MRSPKMKKKIYDTFPICPTENKFNGFFFHKNMSSTITSLKTQISNTESFLTRTAKHKKNAISSKFNYPLTSKPTEKEYPTSALTSTKFFPKTEQKVNHKQFIKPKKKPTELLTFNKKLRLFLNIDKNDKTKQELLKVTQKNIEEIYFDYDAQNHKKKLDMFSGNNANVLRNKILFVKGVMDYMFPRMMIKKMNFLTKAKKKEFENEMKQMKAQISNDIFTPRIKSANDGVLMSKYNNGGTFFNNNVKVGNTKKIMINKKIMLQQLKLSDLIS